MHLEKKDLIAVKNNKKMESAMPQRESNKDGNVLHFVFYKNAFSQFPI